MQIIAHRCGTDRHQEQTIAAARHSLSRNVDYVEVDIRFTKDHKPVVIHDPTPEGLYGVTTPVAELTETEFLALRRVADQSICGHSFRHYLECGIDKMLFHCKAGGEDFEMLVDMCNEYHILDKVVFGLRYPEDVRRLRAYAPDVKILAFMNKPDDIEEMAAAGVDVIRLWEGWATKWPELIQRIRAVGKQLWIMGGNPRTPGDLDDPMASYKKYEAWGADGVLINLVEPAMAYFKGDNK